MSSKHEAIPSPCKSKLQRCSSSTYRKRCSDPSCPTGATPWRNQIHHILCEHAILDIQLEDKIDYIFDCLCLVEWDINNTANLMGLPMKSAYRYSGGRTPVNRPCHNVDHNISGGYTDECKNWLHENIWNNLQVKKKAHPDVGEAIVALLNDCTTHFKGLLAARGIRNDGTFNSWTKRQQQRDTWYEPFSMAETPSPRAPGGRMEGKMWRMFERIL